jgi:hypothetical protein
MNPTWENAAGVGNDLLFLAGLEGFVSGGIGGLASLGRAAEARGWSFGGRCRAGMLGFHSFADWEPGTFPSAERSAIEHFKKHRNQPGVSATTLADYLQKARDARDAALKSGRTGREIPGATENVRRFTGSNDLQYIDINVKTGKIISFGGVKMAPRY